MKEAALATPIGPPLFFQTRRSFSNFQHVEDNFTGDYPAIRRLFSQARSGGGATLVTEYIRPEGVIASENREIQELHPGYRMPSLMRLTFWKRKLETPRDIRRADSRNLLGYAILKQDAVPGAPPRWHVFEAVFRKYNHQNNCVPGPIRYRVLVAGHAFSIEGVIYCQQNGLNKACAQVALRCLCSTQIPLSKISYERINRYAARVRGRYVPSAGLNVKRIRAVLDGFGISYADIDYRGQKKGAIRKLFPYQKILYSGIESGAGALLGFKLTSRRDAHHSIPVFGHTFNQDNWVANASSAYFRVGRKTKYLSSDTWLSSFLGHDDNFGSNYCVPKFYLPPRRVNYALTLLRPGVRYDGLSAEAIAADYLYSLREDGELPDSQKTQKIWVKRYHHYADKQQVILRAISVSKQEYLQHLLRIRDWDNRRLPRAIIALSPFLAQHLWVVEISVPELFPTNRRKLGEIVLDATVRLTLNRDYQTFLCARIPGELILLPKIPNRRNRLFTHWPTKMESHTELLIPEELRN